MNMKTLELFLRKIVSVKDVAAEATTSKPASTSKADTTKKYFIGSDLDKKFNKAVEIYKILTDIEFWLDPSKGKESFDLLKNLSVFKDSKNQKNFKDSGQGLMYEGLKNEALIILLDKNRAFLIEIPYMLADLKNKLSCLDLLMKYAPSSHTLNENYSKKPFITFIKISLEIIESFKQDRKQVNTAKEKLKLITELNLSNILKNKDKLINNFAINTLKMTKEALTKFKIAIRLSFHYEKYNELAQTFYQMYPNEFSKNDFICSNDYTKDVKTFLSNKKFSQVEWEKLKNKSENVAKILAQSLLLFFAKTFEILLKAQILSIYSFDPKTKYKKHIIPKIRNFVKDFGSKSFSLEEYLLIFIPPKTYELVKKNRKLKNNQQKFEITTTALKFQLEKIENEFKILEKYFDASGGYISKRIKKAEAAINEKKDEAETLNQPEPDTVIKEMLSLVKYFKDLQKELESNFLTVGKVRYKTLFSHGEIIKDDGYFDSEIESYKGKEDSIKSQFEGKVPNLNKSFQLVCQRLQKDSVWSESYLSVIYYRLKVLDKIKIEGCDAYSFIQQYLFVLMNTAKKSNIQKITLDTNIYNKLSGNSYYEIHEKDRERVEALISNSCVQHIFYLIHKNFSWKKNKFNVSQIPTLAKFMRSMIYIDRKKLIESNLANFKLLFHHVLKPGTKLNSNKVKFLNFLEDCKIIFEFVAEDAPNIYQSEEITWNSSYYSKLLLGLTEKYIQEILQKKPKPFSFFALTVLLKVIKKEHAFRKKITSVEFPHSYKEIDEFYKKIKKSIRNINIAPGNIFEKRCFIIARAQFLEQDLKKYGDEFNYLYESLIYLFTSKLRIKAKKLSELSVDNINSFIKKGFDVTRIIIVFDLLLYVFNKIIKAGNVSDKKIVKEVEDLNSFIKNLQDWSKSKYEKSQKYLILEDPTLIETFKLYFSRFQEKFAQGNSRDCIIAHQAALESVAKRTVRGLIKILMVFKPEMELDLKFKIIHLAELLRDISKKAKESNNVEDLQLMQYINDFFTGLYYQWKGNVDPLHGHEELRAKYFEVFIQRKLSKQLKLFRSILADSRNVYSLKALIINFNGYIIDENAKPEQVTENFTYILKTMISAFVKKSWDDLEIRPALIQGFNVIQNAVNFLKNKVFNAQLKGELIKQSFEYCNKIVCLPGPSRVVIEDKKYRDIFVNFSDIQRELIFSDPRFKIFMQKYNKPESKVTLTLLNALAELLLICESTFEKKAKNTPNAPKCLKMLRVLSWNTYFNEAPSIKDFIKHLQEIKNLKQFDLISELAINKVLEIVNSLNGFLDLENNVSYESICNNVLKSFFALDKIIIEFVFKTIKPILLCASNDIELLTKQSDFICFLKNQKDINLDEDYKKTITSTFSILAKRLGFSTQLMQASRFWEFLLLTFIDWQTSKEKAFSLSTNKNNSIQSFGLLFQEPYRLFFLGLAFMIKYRTSEIQILGQKIAVGKKNKKVIYRLRDLLERYIKTFSYASASFGKFSVNYFQNTARITLTLKDVLKSRKKLQQALDNMESILSGINVSERLKRDKNILLLQEKYLRSVGYKINYSKQVDKHLVTITNEIKNIKVNAEGKDPLSAKQNAFETIFTKDTDAKNAFLKHIRNTKISMEKELEILNNTINELTALGNSVQQV
ncbi:hypothetical protein ACFLZV_01695 [Candidatus Margulisiibacteriota bacterium]